MFRLQKLRCLFAQWPSPGFRQKKERAGIPARMLILKISKDSKVRAKSLVLADNGFLGF